MEESNDAGRTGPEPVVLLVDDTPTNLQVLFKTLSGRGLKLLIAKDGESALEVARSEMIKTRATVQAARAERSAAFEQATLRERERDPGRRPVGSRSVL